MAASDTIQISLTNLGQFKDNLPTYIDGLGFLKNTANNLVNYYKKTETYTQTEVNNLIAQYLKGVFVPVSVLPTASADTMGKIYLVPSEDPETLNVKEEWITINTGTESVPVYAWEHIGSTKIDLSDYSTTDEMNAAIAAAIAPFKTEAQIKTIVESYGYLTQTAADGRYVQQVAGKGLSTNDYTTTEKNKLDGIAAGAEVNVLNGVNANVEGTSSALPIVDKKVTLVFATEAQIDAMFE